MGLNCMGPLICRFFSIVNTVLLHNLPHGCIHGFRMLDMAKPWRQRAGSKLHSDFQLCWVLNNSQLQHYFKGQLQLLHRNIFGLWKETLDFGRRLLLKLARYRKFDRMDFLILCAKLNFLVRVDEKDRWLTLIFGLWYWLVTQLCLTICDPMDCNPPGSSVHGILQERLLKWVAMTPSRGSSRPRDRT